MLKNFLVISFSLSPQGQYYAVPLCRLTKFYDQAGQEWTTTQRPLIISVHSTDNDRGVSTFTVPCPPREKFLQSNKYSTDKDSEMTPHAGQLARPSSLHSLKLCLMTDHHSIRSSDPSSSSRRRPSHEQHNILAASTSWPQHPCNEFYRCYHQ